MKKLKTIFGVILRAAIFLSPGIGSGICFNNAAPALTAIFAGIGVELIFLFAWAAFGAVVKEYRRSVTQPEDDDSESL